MQKVELSEKERPFHWKCEPEAEKLVKGVLEDAVSRSPFLQQLGKELLQVTSTRLFDWIDHVELGYSDSLSSQLTAAGFVSTEATPLYRIFHHPGAQLPKIVVNDRADATVSVAVGVESIADFLMVRGMSQTIAGSPLGPFRRATVARDGGVVVSVVERRGSLAMEPVTLLSDDLLAIYEAHEKWKRRPRGKQARGAQGRGVQASGAQGEDEEMDCLRHAISIAEELVERLGIGMSASIVLEVERQYWQAKNRAGQLQKNRQDRLGMGWANHDHHTFRCSRSHFRHTVRLFEILGFHCRERFYAGKEAGWGAQVMEHQTGRFVLFLDVDLDEHELHIDFAHQELPELNHLGTIGLWCALHGESILTAGMHHLEAQFAFTSLTEDLKEHGVSMMPPFSDLPYLKQAFTVGEMWSVDPKRVQRLLEQKLITKEQADRFLSEGALGSHLENLQREEGFKGFNQKNVSAIIKKTDPRRIAIGMA